MVGQGRRAHVTVLSHEEGQQMPLEVLQHYPSRSKEETAFTEFRLFGLSNEDFRRVLEYLRQSGARFNKASKSWVATDFAYSTVCWLLSDEKPNGEFGYPERRRSSAPRAGLRQKRRHSGRP
jgi:hypothetical protein